VQELERSRILLQRLERRRILVQGLERSKKSEQELERSKISEMGKEIHRRLVDMGKIVFGKPRVVGNLEVACFLSG